MNAMGTIETSPSSVADYIRSLSAEDKDAALVELVREVIRETGGKSAMPVRTREGEDLGYYLPPAVVGSRLEGIYAMLTPDQLDRSRKAVATLNDTFDMDEFIDRLGSRSPEIPAM